MNFKLANDFSFSAVIIDGSNIFPNFYNIKINMETMTENNNYQNIAIQRILVFLQEMLDGCIFCSENNPIEILEWWIFIQSYRNLWSPG